MRDILADLKRWRNARQATAVATVVKAWGSSPRPLGSKMAINEAGEMSGSVSGGCVEGAVREEALGVLRSGTPKLLHYGVTDERAWEVGLSCGGQIEILVEPLKAPVEGSASLQGELERALEAGEMVTRVAGLGGGALGQQLLVWPAGQTRGDLGSPRLNQRASNHAQKAMRSGFPRRIEVDAESGSVDLFLEVLPPPDRLVVVGAVHAAIPLCDFAHRLGFRTIVVDPRSAFATEGRFARADEISTEWPDAALTAIGLDESTYVVLLSHDMKLDLPALSVVLPSKAPYIGALGSRKTHAKRVRALTEAGHSESEIERIHAPVGLDLGGRRAEEIALAIMAEIVAVKHGRGRRASGG